MDFLILLAFSYRRSHLPFIFHLEQILFVLIALVVFGTLNMESKQEEGIIALDAQQQQNHKDARKQRNSNRQSRVFQTITLQLDQIKQQQ